MPPSSSTPHLSIVIPAYNEESRLPATLERIWSYLQSRPYSGEIIIMDDGSADATLKIGQEFAQGKAAQVLSPGHQGKGGAIRSGMMAATGDYVLMTDADLSTPLECVEDLLAAMDAGFDVAIGSRALKESVLTVRQPPYREMMGRAGNRIIQTALLPGIQDTQCGFKLFRRAAAREIFSRSVLNGVSFDIEVLYLARQLGFRIKEVPVRWAHKSGSKVRIVRDYLATLRDLFLIRRLHGDLQPVTRPANS